MSESDISKNEEVPNPVETTETEETVVKQNEASESIKKDEEAVSEIASEVPTEKSTEALSEQVEPNAEKIPEETESQQDLEDHEIRENLSLTEKGSNLSVYTHDNITEYSVSQGNIVEVESETFHIQADESELEEEEEEEPKEPHPLDEFTDQQVIDLVQEIESENLHLELENILFESFLRENDASLLEGLDEIMSFLSGDSTVSSHVSKEIQISCSTISNKYKLDSYTSITSIAEGKGPKINLSQKTDMLMRAMEENQNALEAFLKKCHITKRNLKSELDEFSIREVEIKEATDIFEYNVVTQGVDKLTQRIPAEKFIRYMEEWLKSAQFQIEKLRLRIATLKVQYKKVSQQLIQRQELGENVHAVDFDQLEIENKHFVEKIEQKNIHLLELKKMNGGANLVLSEHKKFLQKQQEDCNQLKVAIDDKNAQIEMTEKECEEAEQQIDAQMEKYQACRDLYNQYTVPDVMDYVRLKGKLHELRKNIKIWTRRRKIQDIALNTCLRQMKNLTGRIDIDPKWFEDTNGMDGSGSDDILI